MRQQSARLLPNRQATSRAETHGPKRATYREVYRKIRDAFAPAAHHFDEATRDPAQSQLKKICELSAHALGENVDSFAGFQSAARLSGPEDVALEMNDLLAGRRQDFGGHQVRWVEESGGSVGRRRLLPMTDALIAEFGAGLRPWLFDLFTTSPGIENGPAYWAISPAGRRSPRTDGGLQIGAACDSSYLPEPFADHFRELLAVGPEIADIGSLDTWRYCTILQLLRCRELAFISIWSPSFLSLLLEELEIHQDRLIADVRLGTSRPPAELRRQAGVAVDAQPHPRRADELKEVLRWQASNKSSSLSGVWPKLALISMWTDASSQPFADEVRARLPEVEVQGKGLLATEGIVTLPLRAAPAPVLAVQSHLYEFIPSGGGRPLFAHELSQDETYEVVLSTSGGLLRYRLGDRVRVAGYYHSTPCFHFVGRAGIVSDLVGEKLSADDVESAWKRVSVGKLELFVLLAPVSPSIGAAHYRLFVQSKQSDESLQKLAQELDRELCRAHPYRYARDLGQLAPINVVRVAAGRRRYEARCVTRGQRAGDIKPALFSHLADWELTFTEECL